MKKILLITAMLLTGAFAYSQADTWTQKADFGGTGRDYATGFSIGSKGYIGTGFERVVYNDVGTKDFWEYDLSTDTWTQKADFAGYARWGAVGFSIGSKGYIGTGYADSNSHLIDTKDFWEYDPSTNTWTRKADLAGYSRRKAVGFSIGSKGYIGTGVSERSGYTNDFWEYDPAANTWTQKADFGGTARQGSVGFSIGSKGYIGTGTHFSGDKNDFWEYDPSTDTWTQKADFGGHARWLAVGFSIGSKGYLGTGYPTYRDFWEYDPAANNWVRKADFGGYAGGNGVGFSIGSKGYIGTGLDYDNPPYAVRDFWEYTPGNSCPAPISLKVPHISDTCAVLRWNGTGAGSGISYVQLRYRAVGETTWRWRKKDAAKNIFYINELMPNTTYQWQLRSLCTEDSSGWVKGPDFTTAASFTFSSTASAITGDKLPGNIALRIMPNPNNGNFTVQLQLPAKAAITSLALYNNMGAKIWQQDAGKISGLISRNIALESKLSTGVYVLMIQHGDKRLMQKVIVTK